MFLMNDLAIPICRSRGGSDARVAVYASGEGLSSLPKSRGPYRGIKVAAIPACLYFASGRNHLSWQKRGLRGMPA
jgi:hypothetical protein